MWPFSAKDMGHDRNFRNFKWYSLNGVAKYVVGSHIFAEKVKYELSSRSEVCPQN